MHFWKSYNTDNQRGKLWLCLLLSFNKHLLCAHHVPGTKTSSAPFTWPKTMMCALEWVRTEISVYEAASNAEWWRVGIYRTLFGSLSFKLHHILPTPNCDKYVLFLSYFPNTLSAWKLWTYAMSNWHDPSPSGIFSAPINMLLPLPPLVHFCQFVSHISGAVSLQIQAPFSWSKQMIKTFYIREDSVHMPHSPPIFHATSKSPCCHFMTCSSCLRGGSVPVISKIIVN